MSMWQSTRPWVHSPAKKALAPHQAGRGLRVHPEKVQAGADGAWVFPPGYTTSPFQAMVSASAQLKSNDC